MLRIDITPFKAGEVHEFELAPEPADVDLDPETFEEVRVEARLDVHRDRILVRLHVRATATLTCDRTLQSFQQPLEGSYSLLFGPPRMVGQEGDSYEEVRPLQPSDQEIDITDAVRDTLLLAIPQRRIAPGAEEEEITTQFGPSGDEEEEPIDPRWEALRDLRNGS